MLLTENTLLSLYVQETNKRLSDQKEKQNRRYKFKK